MFILRTFNVNDVKAMDYNHPLLRTEHINKICYDNDIKGTTKELFIFIVNYLKSINDHYNINTNGIEGDWLNKIMINTYGYKENYTYDGDINHLINKEVIELPYSTIKDIKVNNKYYYLINYKEI